MWWRGCGGAVVVWCAVAVAGMAGLSGCAFRRQPSPDARGEQVGVASWYGPGFHGKRTASGEVYDQHDLTAAHRSLPLGSEVTVTNLRNGRAVDVRINDRGPFVAGRVIDLSYEAARTLAMIGPGTAPVRLELRDAPSSSPELPSVSYAVQVASLRDAERAERLRAALAERFPDTFVRPLDEATARYYRVRLGPYAARGAAEARATAVERLGYRAVVVEEPPP
jgi:rare lipoprotein A